MTSTPRPRTPRTPPTPRTSRRPWARSAPVVGLAACALLLSACGSGGRGEGEERGSAGAGGDVGVTDDTITIGAHFPLTGVAAPGYSEIPVGAKAYFDYVNANGGINGRQIDYLVRDDGYNPTNTSTVVDELVLQDEVFAMVGGLGTPTHSAVVDFLNDEGVPDLFVSSGARAWGDDPEAKPYTFGWQPDYEIEGKIIGQYIAENMPDAKVGLFLQDDDLGRDSESGVRQYLDDQIVSVQRYTSGNTDVGPQIAGLQSDGADLVLGFNTPSYTALSQLAALGVGYDPEWFYSNIGSDPALVGGLLDQFSEGQVEGGNALDGVLTTQYIPGVEDTDDPWTQLWNTVWEEEGGDGELTNFNVYGMSHAYAFVQTLAEAGPDLTRDGVVDALESLGEADQPGPQLAPFRYSADSHFGISGMRVAELQGGAPEPLTEVLVSDVGDAEITEDDSGQAEDAPPESGIPE